MHFHFIALAAPPLYAFHFISIIFDFDIFDAIFSMISLRHYFRFHFLRLHFLLSAFDRAFFALHFRLLRCHFPLFSFTLFITPLCRFRHFASPFR
jgi:hypothetical protein